MAEALVSLVADLDAPLRLLVGALCYVLGLIAFVQGMMRLLRASQDQFHAPPAAGTAMCFVICAVLVTLPSWLGAAGESLFGTGATPAALALAYDGATAPDWSALLAAVVTVVRFIGLYALIRGVFVVRAAADGKHEATMGGAAMHLLGGVLAWHIVPVIDAVQTSLGIRVLTAS